MGGSKYVFAFVCVAAVQHQAAHGLQILNGTADSNDRFDNDPNFIADSFDLSGVGLNGNGRWLTMLSRNVYATAEHFKPGTGSSVTFFETNDPNGPTATRSVTSDTQQVGTDTDIFLGTLDSALPTSFNFYDFATEDINSAPGGPGSFSQSRFNGENAYVFGRSNSGVSYPTEQDYWVGRNVLDQFFSGAQAANNTGDAIGATDDRETTDAVSFEAQLETGDSGGPLFVDDSGSLTMVGANWFTGTSGGEDVFGASYFGNYDAEIQDFIDANEVPEPAVYALALGSLALAGALRKRRARRG